MAAMGRTGMKRLSLKKEGFELQLEREENELFRSTDQALDLAEEALLAPGELPQRRTTAALGRAKETGSTIAGPAAEAEKEDLSCFITSPMVGTFYASPSPDDPGFVKKGDTIEKNSVVCII